MALSISNAATHTSSMAKLANTHHSNGLRVHISRVDVRKVVAHEVIMVLANMAQIITTHVVVVDKTYSQTI